MGMISLTPRWAIRTHFTVHRSASWQRSMATSLAARTSRPGSLELQEEPVLAKTGLSRSMETGGEKIPLEYAGQDTLAGLRNPGLAPAIAAHTDAGENCTGSPFRIRCTRKQLTPCTTLLINRRLMNIFQGHGGGIGFFQSGQVTRSCLDRKNGMERDNRNSGHEESAGIVFH